MTNAEWTEHSGKVERELGSFGTKLDSLDGQMKRVLECIEGDGKPGLKSRMEALERDAKDRKWWTRTAISSGMLAAFGFLGELALKLFGK